MKRKQFLKNSLINTYFDSKLLRQISFWREKRVEKKEIRSQFNMELYLKILEIKNS